MTSHGARRLSAGWRPGWLRAALATALALAGVMLILTPEHFAESTAMGLGFIAAGIAKLGLAATVLLQPSRLVYVAVVAVTAALIGLYAFNVLFGLRFAGASEPSTHDERSEHSGTGEHGDEHSGGLIVGSGEPIDASGAATKLSEAVALGVAVVLVSRRDRATG